MYVDANLFLRSIYHQAPLSEVLNVLYPKSNPLDHFDKIVRYPVCLLGSRGFVSLNRFPQHLQYVSSFPIHPYDIFTKGRDILYFLCPVIIYVFCHIPAYRTFMGTFLESEVNDIFRISVFDFFCFVSSISSKYAIISV